MKFLQTFLVTITIWIHYRIHYQESSYRLNISNDQIKILDFDIDLTYFYRYYFRIEIYLRISRNNRNEETNRGTPSLSFVATLNGVDLLHASWSSLQPVPGTLSTCRYSAPGHHVDFMRFYSHNYRTALQKSVVFVVDR